MWPFTRKLTRKQLTEDFRIDVGSCSKLIEDFNFHLTHRIDRINREDVWATFNNNQLCDFYEKFNSLAVEALVDALIKQAKKKKR